MCGGCLVLGCGLKLGGGGWLVLGGGWWVVCDWVVSDEKKA